MRSTEGLRARLASPRKTRDDVAGIDPGRAAADHVLQRAVNVTVDQDVHPGISRHPSRAASS